MATMNPEAMDTYDFTSIVAITTFDDTVTIYDNDSGIKKSRVTWAVIVYMVLGSIGIIDNGFTLVVIFSSKSMRQKVTNKLIINQSAIDWVASLLLIANAPTLADPRSPPGVAGQLWCRLWVSNYLLWSVLSSSSFNLIAITIERYTEIVKPLIYKQLFTPTRAKLAMGMVWAAGFILITLPNFGPSGVIDGVCVPYSMWPSPIGASVAGVITFLAVYLAPIVVMVFCYTRMIFVFNAKVAPESKTQSNAEKRRAEKLNHIRRNILKTLIIVAVAFVMCWTCNQTAFFLYNLGVKVDLFGTYFQVFVFFTFSNCCINPFIYTFQYHEFQIALRKLLGIKRSNPDDDDTEIGTVSSAVSTA